MLLPGHFVEVMSSMAYRPYRGQHKNRRNRILLMVTVLLLLIIGGIGFFAAQQYVVFTADGFRFDFPFNQGRATEPPATGPQGTLPTPIIEGTEPTEPPTTVPPTTAPPEKREGLTRARLVPFDDYADVALPQGAVQKAVYIKDESGALRLPLVDVGRSAFPEPTQDQLDAAEQLRATGDIAVISVYRDHDNAARWRANAITVEGGQTWLDAQRNRWLNPYAQSGATDTPDGTMLADDLIARCAQLELGEVVLTSFQFPTQGRLDLIHYGDQAATPKTDALSAAADSLRQRFPERSPMLLSCLLTETAALEYIDQAAGQDVRALAQSFDILYVPTADPDYDTGPLMSYIDGTGCRIGLWLAQDSLPQRQIDCILVK